jgi:molecular chaperone GrpE
MEKFNMSRKKNETQEYKKFNPENREDIVVEEAKTPEIVEETEKDVAPVELLKQEIDSLKDKNLRLQAEFDNYRKRTYKEITAARQSGLLDSLMPILQVFDHFSMAMQAVESAENMNAMRDGLKMIYSEFEKAVDELGIEKVDAAGQVFDPNIHEAMAEEPSDEVEEGMVIKQWCCGYKIGEKLIRPASVVVSSGKETK